MADLLEHLHDEIDDRESAIERAHAIIERIRTEEMPKLLAEERARGGDPVNVLIVIAERITQELAPLFRERVRAGADAALVRRQKFGGGT